MIRFVDLRNLSYEGSTEFAFFNTVTDSFKEFAVEQVWESKAEFIDAFEAVGGDANPIERYTDKIPDWVPDKGR